MRNYYVFATCLYVAVFLCLLFRQGVAIDCFVCDSINSSNPYCSDPFNTTKQNYLRTSCKGYKKGRDGSFPADHCIKVKGEAVGNPNHSVVIRTCSLDSGTLTADTEIVRMSHCGHFYFDNQYFAGCVQSCNKDGCNDVPALRPHLGLPLLLALCVLVRLITPYR